MSGPQGPSLAGGLMRFTTPTKPAFLMKSLHENVEVELTLIQSLTFLNLFLGARWLSLSISAAVTSLTMASGPL